MGCSQILCLFAILSGGTISPSDVEPGMTGWGSTVFKGVEPDTFGVTILGVTQRGSTPGGQRILVRLTGAQIESTGVAAGMSGSPIFMNGHLLGALSASFPFSSEPMALVTPIAGMLQESTRGGKRIVSMPGARLPLAGSGPGFTPEALSIISGQLGTGCMILTSGGAEVPAGTAGELAPGQPASVVLVDGDWNLAVTGTVTWRDGQDLAAFGHPFLGLGEVDLPLAGGSVTAVVPSRALSFKIGSTGPIVGRVRFDGSNGIRGEVGDPPPMLPLHVEVGTPARKHFDLRLALHQSVTPILLRTCVANSMGAVEGAMASNVSARLQLFLNGGNERGVTSIRRGLGAVQAVAEEMSGLLNGVLNCPLGPITVDSLHVKMTVTPMPQEFFLHSIALAPPGVVPGADHLSVRVELLTNTGEMFSTRVKLDLPPGLSGKRLTIRAGDYEAMNRWEKERSPLLHVPGSMEEYLDELLPSWMPDRLYLVLYSATEGWSRRGGEVSRLPRSFAKILGRANQMGEFDLPRQSVLSRTELGFDGRVYGSAVIELPSTRGKQ